MTGSVILKKQTISELVSTCQIGLKSTKIGIKSDRNWLI